MCIGGSTTCPVTVRNIPSSFDESVAFSMDQREVDASRQPPGADDIHTT